MNGYSINQDSGYSSILSDSTEELRTLYESILSGKASGNLMASCPVQTVASETTNLSTEYARQIGLSSLPSTLNVIDNGLISPVETTVLDSSGPLDGISLHHLLYAVVEITPESLPSVPRYHGSNGVIVEVDDISCSVCVEMSCDSSRLKIAKSRMLKLCPPMTGDVVRVIRGSGVGSVGCITSQNDGSRAIVRVEDNSSSDINIGDLVRLDSSVATQCSSSNSSPPSNVGIEDSSTCMSTNTYSPPAYATGWRVNSPIPPSPIDSVTYENSPSSSLISNSVTSPSNSWNTSNDPCPIKDFTFGLPSESHNHHVSADSPSGSVGSGNMYSTQSLPNPSTKSDVFSNPTKSESYQSNSYTPASTYPSSLPPLLAPSFHNGGMSRLSAPTHCGMSPVPSKLSPSPSGNLYPVLNDESNGYSPQPSPSAGSQSNSHVGYQTLPSYATPNNYPQPASSTTTYSQQAQYTPVLLGNANANTGYALYGYQQSATPLYQPKSGISMYSTVPGQPQSYQYTRVGPSNLYPQLPSYSMSQQQPYPRQQQVYGNNQLQPTNYSNKKQSQSTPAPLYPKLPQANGGPQSSPWNEFRILVSSMQSRLPTEKRSLEMVIDLAIEALCQKEPPDHWYNPLAQSDDEEMSISDVSTESVRVSALCPLIRTKMEYPCRGLECTHLQCFDAKAYLRLALKRRSQMVSTLKGSVIPPSCHPDNGWKCPTCGKVVSVSQLYIDKYLRQAINSYHDTVELEFKGPGRWLPYEKCRAPSNTVIDLTMDSDEDS